MCNSKYDRLFVEFNSVIAWDVGGTFLLLHPQKLMIKRS